MLDLENVGFLWNIESWEKSIFNFRVYFLRQIVKKYHRVWNNKWKNYNLKGKF